MAMDVSSWVGKDEKCTGMTSALQRRDGPECVVLPPTGTNATSGPSRYSELDDQGQEVVKGQEVHWDDQYTESTIGAEVTVL
jgi:hypothetical protein